MCGRTICVCVGVLYVCVWGGGGLKAFPFTTRFYHFISSLEVFYFEPVRAFLVSID